MLSASRRVAEFRRQALAAALEGSPRLRRLAKSDPAAHRPPCHHLRQRVVQERRFVEGEGPGGFILAFQLLAQILNSADIKIAQTSALRTFLTFTHDGLRRPGS